jgi:CelD/BcsL family acetyltransferase involved in cellulose biosynthesis
MNVALRLEPAPDLRQQPQSVARAERFSHIEILDDMTLAEPIWRRLEREDAVTSPYQSFNLLSGWQRHVGQKNGVTPFIVIGIDAGGKPAFLLPLGRIRRGPLNVASFLGSKHANFNFGLWRRDLVKSFTAEDIRSVMDQIAAARYQVDVFNLLSQPLSWEGFVNPLTFLPHQSSPSDGVRLALRAPGEELVKTVLSPAMRGRLRTKERRLQRLKGYRYIQATTPAEVDRLLDTFFSLKAAHMAAQALPNIFAEPGNEAFLREACHQGLSTGNSLIEIHALEADGELLALFAGITDGRRFSGMFNTYTLSDNARQSPGLVLLTHIIAKLADRGMQVFDLGVGEAHYKTFFCKEPEPLFDSFLPLTPLGRIAAFSAGFSYRMKRRIKRSRALWNLVGRLRHGWRGRDAQGS